MQETKEEKKHLLNEREITSNKKAAEDPLIYISEYTKEEDVIAVNIKTAIKHTVKMKMNTKRFTVKQRKLDGKLSCPICNSWSNAINFSRYAKKHNMTYPGYFYKWGVQLRK